MRLHWVKKVVDDLDKQTVLKCYELKKKMSICIEQNEGDIKNCNHFRREFEDCLNIIEKRIKTQEKTVHTDLASLYN